MLYQYLQMCNVMKFVDSSLSFAIGIKYCKYHELKSNLWISYHAYPYWF